MAVNIPNTSVPTVNLVGYRTKSTHELHNTFAMYTLFVALLDCELAARERQRRWKPSTLSFALPSFDARLERRRAQLCDRYKKYIPQHEIRWTEKRGSMHIHTWPWATKYEMASPRQLCKKDASVGCMRAELPRSSLSRVVFPPDDEVEVVECSGDTAPEAGIAALKLDDGFQHEMAKSQHSLPSIPDTVDVSDRRDSAT